MSKLKIKMVENEKELEDAFFVRETVFMQEQGVSREEEMDEFDETATHVIAYYNGKVAGCARLRSIGDRSKLERIAVLSAFRRKGVGKGIVEFLVDLSRKKGSKEAVMNAQIAANDFYVKCGFRPRGDEFMEAGIRHVEMFMELKGDA